MLNSKVVVMICAFLFMVYQLFAQPIFNADGKKVGRASGISRSPIIVVDTVRLDTGYAKINLNSTFGNKGIHNVTAFSKDRIWASVTQILDSLNQVKHSYGYIVSSNGRTVEIKSDSTNDSSKVAFIMILN